MAVVALYGYIAKIRALTDIRNPTLELLERLIRQFLRALTQMSVAGKLWIVEPGRIRIHQSEINNA